MGKHDTEADARILMGAPKRDRRQPMKLAKQSSKVVAARVVEELGGYHGLVDGISDTFVAARGACVRTVNAIMTAAYWDTGRQIVEYEQGGAARAEYGAALLKRLSGDLTPQMGRGFSPDNLETMRLFYQAYPVPEISETLSRKLPVLKSEQSPRISSLQEWAQRFPLSWSHYVLLVRRSRSPQARAFYEEEALRGGWPVRTLDRHLVQ